MDISLHLYKRFGLELKSRQFVWTSVNCVRIIIQNLICLSALGVTDSFSPLYQTVFLDSVSGNDIYHVYQTPTNTFLDITLS